jgi:SAM-dependent methyltransferase
MTGVTLIGGEMPDWSDRGPDDRPAVGGAVLAEILCRIAPGSGRVLVAGPHDDTLIEALGTRAEVVCLVRSEVDAVRLARRGVPVLCGTLAKLTEADCYDVVVALDGLDRLCSVEGAQLDWADGVQVLRRVLRPGGSLLLAVENELGVHRLVDRSAPTSAHGPGDWRPVGEFDETRPGNPTRLAARLSTDGLAVTWVAAAWPVPSEPTLLATPNALRDGPVGALSAAAAAAVGSAYAGRPVLSDPRRLAAAAVRGGLGAEFASSWIVLAHRAPRPMLEFAPPPVLLGDGPVVELTRDRDGGWVRTVVSSLPGRDDSGLTGPLPKGRLLEELLLAACLRHDLRTARRLLTGWALSAGPGTFDNVLVDGDTFALLDPSRAPVSPAAAVRRFAETLLSGGYAHPWASATDLGSLAAVLGAAAGLDELPPQRADSGPADELAELPPQRAGSGPAAGLDDLPPQRAGSGPADELPPRPAESGPAFDSLREHFDSVREQEEQLRRLREQLADADDRATWFAAELAGRDAELRRARLQIKAFSGKIGYRVAKLGAVGARKALRRLRKDR